MQSTILMLLTSALLSTSVFAGGADERKPATIQVKRISPVLYVAEVEPCVKFWVERMGFEAGAQVPDGDELAFAIVQKGDLELMYQSYASAEKDQGSATEKVAPHGSTFLYVEVDDLDRALSAMQGVDLVQPVHTTFYGMKEFIVKDPGGHLVTFAQPAQK